MEMKKVRKTVFVVAMLGLQAVCGPVLAFSGAGSGTEADPYVITNVQQLQEMKDAPDACYVLGCNIDACDTRTWNGGAGFEPVGPFEGKFDGRGRTVTGLYMNWPGKVRTAVFESVVTGAQVRNVVLRDVDISGAKWVGALVGTNLGVVLDCAVTGGRVVGSGVKNGGLVGGNYASSAQICRCYADVSVTGGGEQTGGLLGVNRAGARVSDCYALGSVSGSNKVGGLVGDNMGEGYGTRVERCYSAGRVSGSGGGLIGYNWRGGVTRDSYWDVQTSGKTSSRGGTGKNTAQMMQQATFVNWDFVDVWDILENETYPFLRFFAVKLEVAVDIKPGGCPNPLNLVSRGVLPVAVLGTEDFDVNDIDPVSVRLAGAPSVRSSYEDVAAPAVDRNDCDCNTVGPDGHIDLSLKFKTQDIVAQMAIAPEDLAEGVQLILTLTGSLFDGTPIEGVDCLVVVGKLPAEIAAKKSDIDGDGLVNIRDLAVLVEHWLELASIEY
ncbi:MAG: GLUG motif-containing protein [Planctomycetota bacterium]|jgi:hypothetical protein